MPSKVLPEPTDPVGLRARAHFQLDGGLASQNVAASATSAYRVLFDLASSPDTAADALALLHELQVHQVELTLQAEELRTACTDLECALARQRQLYDHAPVALMTLDDGTRLVELNLAAAQQLGQDREALMGQRLDGLLAPHSASVLRDMLARLQAMTPDITSDVADNTATHAELMVAAGPPSRRGLHAQARVDPASGRFLLALTNTSPQAVCD